MTSVRTLPDDDYRRMMEMSTVLGVIADLEGRVVSATPGWRSVLGYSPERLDGTPYLELVHADDLPNVKDQLAILRQSGTETSNVEVRMRARDGSYRWILWNLRGDMEARRIYGVGYDMTERHLVEDELIHAREAALQASHEKSRFLANMSHEIRTPMNGILGMTAMLMRSPMTPEQQDLLQSVHQSGEALLAILNDILDISKIEARRMTLSPAPFDLRQLVDATVAPYRPRAHDRGIGLSVDLGSEVPARVTGDAGRIGQILRNLLSNALKFTDEGAVSLRVALDPDGIRFSVHDTGPGIDAAHHERIFEPFRQADDSTTRRHGGTGLGLSISRELAMMMGGRLWVESTPGRGSTFHCVLPLPLADGQAGTLPVSAQEPDITLGYHVLVAEDNAVNARVARLMLRKLGCRVTVAETGRKVFELIDSTAESFDLVLMDVQMPDIDGLQATRAIREREQQRASGRLPIIALTANAMKGDEQRCLEAGMDGYLSKPVRLEGLEREIRRVLTRRPLAS